MKDKTDFDLGKKVQDYLKACGVETPTVASNYTEEEKIEKITENFKQIMEILGLDLKDDSLMDTPKRVSKMFVREIFSGLDYKNFPKCTVIENKMRYDEVVVEKNITAISNCEHHFVVIDGLANVGYIPKDKVLGLSKINRIVEFFCKRPQVQERLAEQIFHALVFILGTEDVAVVLNGKHYCVAMRGVNDTNSTTTTSKLGGRFKTESSLRAEFLNLIKNK
jgi:GTP cyclohydrolase I